VRLEKRLCLRAEIRFTGEKYCLRLSVVVSIVSFIEGCSVGSKLSVGK